MASDDNTICHSFRPNKLTDANDFGDSLISTVEETHERCARARAAIVSTDLDESFFLKPDVSLTATPDDAGTEDYGLAADRLRSHLRDEVDVVMTRFVCDVNGTAGDATGGGVKACPFVRRLELVL